MGVNFNADPAPVPERQSRADNGHWAEQHAPAEPARAISAIYPQAPQSLAPLPGEDFLRWAQRLGAAAQSAEEQMSQSPSPGIAIEARAGARTKAMLGWALPSLGWGARQAARGELQELGARVSSLSSAPGSEQEVCKSVSRLLSVDRSLALFDLGGSRKKLTGDLDLPNELVRARGLWLAVEALMAREGPKDLGWLRDFARGSSALMARLGPGALDERLRLSFPEFEGWDAQALDGALVDLMRLHIWAQGEQAWRRPLSRHILVAFTPLLQEPEEPPAPLPFGQERQWLWDQQSPTLISRLSRVLEGMPWDREALAKACADALAVGASRARGFASPIDGGMLPEALELAARACMELLSGREPALNARAVQGLRDASERNKNQKAQDAQRAVEIILARWERVSGERAALDAAARSVDPGAESGATRI